VRRGASWTAAYHRQLTVAAAARPIRGSVGPSASLLAERSWWLLAQTTLARSSVQPLSSGRASSPWSTRPAARPRRRSPMSSRRCPPIPVRCPGSGCPAVRCLVTWDRRPAGPALGRPLSTRRCPAVWCRPRRSGRVRLLHAPAVALGTRVAVAGRPDHQNRWRPRWLAGRRRLDRRSRRPGGGRRYRSRGGQGRSVRTRAAGWVGAAAAALAATRPARPGRRVERRWRAAARWRGSGPQRQVAAPDAWLASLGWGVTTLGGRRRG
jgi:hypothetical protein